MVITKNSWLSMLPGTDALNLFLFGPVYYLLIDNFIFLLAKCFS
jgi:hypothetical protein